jgi:hypothetical protein
MSMSASSVMFITLVFFSTFAEVVLKTLEIHFFKHTFVRTYFRKAYGVC